MAKINDGKGFENFDIEAFKLEKEILKREAEKEAKKGRKKKPRNKHCIFCGNKMKESIVNTDVSAYDNLDDILCAIDDNDENYLKYVCKSCNSFFGLKSSEYGMPVPYPGWNPETAIKRLDKAKETGYAIILKSQKFCGPSGNNIEVEFGDIFPIKRVSADGDSKMAIDFYSIDIMVGPELLKLFPWEFGTISWAEIMIELRDGQYETVYLDDDIEGYFEPIPEVREQIIAMFGER